MALHGIPFWKKAPFVKILLAFAAGILVQWCFGFHVRIWWPLLISGVVVTTFFFFIPLFSRYKYSIVTGMAVMIIFFSAGALMCWYKDVRHHKQWLGNFYKDGNALIVTIDEPLVEKTRSWKADAKVSCLLRDGRMIPVEGTIILYFRKELPQQPTDSILSRLAYGSRIIFQKPIQEISSAGNPGGFDYKQYSLFRGVTHQVFLSPGEYQLLPGKKENGLKKIIYASREKILQIIKTNISSDKESGLAEALLIGYKNDLEQSLLQSYTHTGVVHIIAISGLHLGLIYWLLLLLLNPFLRYPGIKWIKPVVIIFVLWAFSLLAGAQPSVLRSAMMFSFIVLGETFARRTSIYNTLASSAFVLLCINPFWLWDVGFQLSYAAVLGIVIFMRPIYNWFYCRNKILDFIWKMNAVTLAAQVLTLPLSIYHFHQFPTLFLLTNFVAVPLSSAILLGEIFLCIISFTPAVALFAGKGLAWLIWLMNTYIERIEMIPFSLWDRLQINIPQAIFMTLLTAGLSFWLMEKAKNGLKLAFFALAGFIILRSHSFLQSGRQHRIIVYNIPQKKALDFMEGRKYVFIGDTDLRDNDFAGSFYLKPARTLYRVNKSGVLNGLYMEGNYISYRGKHILLIDGSLSFFVSENKPVIDLLVLSKNPKVDMKKLSGALDIRQVVFDGSNPRWKVQQWKKDCDSLQLPACDVTTCGAFVMNLR